MGEESELLFFDTYSHESQEDNLDLVRFNHWVCITEIRIIPLGAKVQSYFGEGNFRLGATNPSDFKLEFFVIDYDKRMASTFEKLGTMNYKHNVEIQYLVSKKIITDGLVLRGFYRTLTLAVYGYQAKVPKEKTSPPPPPPPQPVQRNLTQLSGESDVTSTNSYSQVKPIITTTPAPTFLLPTPKFPPVDPAYGTSTSYNYVKPYHHHPPLPQQPAEIDPPASYETMIHPHQIAWEGGPAQPIEENYERADKSIRMDDDRRGLSRRRDFIRDDYGRDSMDGRYKTGGGREYQDYHHNNRNRNFSGSDKSGVRSREGNYCLEVVKASSPPPPPTKIIRPKTPPSPPDKEQRQGPRTPKEDEPPSEDPECKKPPSPSNIQSHSELLGPAENEPFEEIVSEEEMMSDNEERIDGEMIEDEMLTDAFSFTINQYHCEFGPLQHFYSPYLTKFEIKKLNKEPELEVVETLQAILKQFDGIPHTEGWVEAIESLTEIPCTIGDTEVQKLISWVEEGLSLDSAMKQPQTTFKVRHLKAGIHLATLLFDTEPAIIDQLLEADIPNKLVSLVGEPYMSLPLKLCIIRALDLVLLTKKGTEYLLNKTHEVGDKSLTGYQQILEYLLQKQSGRTVVALMALLKKCHLYEALQHLKENTQKVIENDEKSPLLPDDPHLQTINGALIEILNCLKTAKHKLAPPHQYLPARHQFEIPKCTRDPMQTLYRMFKENLLLENLFDLYSCPSIAYHDIIVSIKNLFLHFLKSQDGCLFLLSSPEIINAFYQAMLQEDGGLDGVNTLSLSMACHLQTLSAVDWLLAQSVKVSASPVDKREIDDPEVVGYLKILSGMVFLPCGRQALANILSLEHNLDAILQFLQFSGEEEHDQKLAKSVSLGYATDLLLLTIHLSDNIHYLEHYKEDLLKFQTLEQSVPKLAEMSKWFLPIKDLQSFNHSAIEPVMEQIKKLENNAASLPIELAICLRIIKSLVIPEDLYSNNLEDCEELKYKFAILKVVSQDGLVLFLKILQSIHQTFLNPFQVTALVGNQGASLLAIIHPIVQMLHLMLSYLILCRGAEFKDLTPISPLLNVHSLMSLIPISSPFYSTASQVQVEIVDILLAYTQPLLDSTESDEALAQSLWTQMVKEVLKFTTLSPSNFMTGLSVISELLPLPLPLHTKKPLNKEELGRALGHRQLWSAHLHPLASHFSELIGSLCATSCIPIQQMLRRVCIQLADLATPTSLIIIRATLDALSQSVNFKEGQELGPVETRILFFLSYLITHHSIKVPFLAIWKGNLKAEEKYIEIINSLLHLFEVHTDKPYQEALVTFLQTLCDPEIGFHTPETGADLPTILANNLPDKEQLTAIISSILCHIKSKKSLPSTLNYSIRTLSMLVEHDYGLFFVKKGLESHSKSLHILLETIVHLFEKDINESISLLSTLLQFLRLLTSPPEDSERKTSFSISHLSKALCWSRKSHPLLDIQVQLQKKEKDEEHLLQNLEEEVSSLISSLESKERRGSEKELVEPTLSREKNDKTSRPVFLVTNDIETEHFNPYYFLSMAAGDDSEQDMEHVSLDLLTISEKYFPNFNLKQTLETLCHSTSSSSNKDESQKEGLVHGKRPLDDTVNPAVVSEVALKKPFIAPMKGCGIGISRGVGNIHSSRPNDPFRSRPPNTSRPPSTHVDDFFAMETNTSPSKRMTKEAGRGNRGGRGNFMSGLPRGRTFNQQIGNAPYAPRRNSPLNSTSFNIRTTSPTTWLNRSFNGKPSTRNFGARGNIQDSSRNLPPPRNRDNVTGIMGSNSPLGSGPLGNRFSRGGGHWQEGPRPKPQDPRFDPGLQGMGRRDIQMRHSRTFTR